MVKLQRIPAPEWAREPQIITDEPGGVAAQQAFQPHLDRILAIVQEQMEQYVNDPEFYRPDELGEEDDPLAFPEMARLTGAYYLDCQQYAKEEIHGRSYNDLVMTFHFLAPSRITQTDDNYVSLEALVKIHHGTQEIEVLPGFDYAAI